MGREVRSGVRAGRLRILVPGTECVSGRSIEVRRRPMRCRTGRRKRPLPTQTPRQVGSANDDPARLDRPRARRTMVGRSTTVASSSPLRLAGEGRYPLAAGRGPRGQPSPHRVRSIVGRRCSNASPGRMRSAPSASRSTSVRSGTAQLHDFIRRLQAQPCWALIVVGTALAAVGKRLGIPAGTLYQAGADRAVLNLSARASCTEVLYERT